MKIGNREFKRQGRTYVWGILNITPDSFSDGGVYNQQDLVLKRVETMIEEGVDVIDLGGESTRPGYTPLSEEEEKKRIVPMIQEIKKRFDIPLSVDTYKSSVASAALEAGADCINDIWGLKWDGGMAKVLAKWQVPCCLMHNRKEAVYHNLLPEIMQDLQESLRLAGEAGILMSNIILDPGIGFAKSDKENLLVLQNMEALHKLDCPLLLGTSRKSVIGRVLDLDVKEREEGTLATTVMAVMKGYQHVRVHDVQKNKRAIAMTRAILQA